MTNSISNVGSASAQLKSAADAAEKLKTISEALDKAAPQETVKPQVDQLILMKPKCKRLKPLCKKVTILLMSAE